MLTALIIVIGSVVVTFIVRDIALRAIDRLPLAKDVRELDARVAEVERVTKELDSALVVERDKVTAHGEYIETARTHDQFANRK